jgi:hypothetical protein
MSSLDKSAGDVEKRREAISEGGFQNDYAAA